MEHLRRHCWRALGDAQPAAARARFQPDVTAIVVRRIAGVDLPKQFRSRLDGGPQAVSVGITLWLRTNARPACNSLSQSQLAIHVSTISLANGVLRFSGKTSIS